jgi:glutathionyl-hydroquinone reductase
MKDVTSRCWRVNKAPMNKQSAVTVFISTLLCASSYLQKAQDLEHTKLHYFGSFLSLNPQGLVPLGKVYDFSVPPNRAQAWEEAADVAA